MKIAFIHDWLDKYGGAERVVTAISEKIGFDFYYAYVNKMDAATLRSTFAGRDVRVTESAFLSHFKPVFRKLMPLFPLAVRLFNKQTACNKVDVVISSSWALSKGYRIGNEMHICYFQARNFKYVWDEADLYFRGPAKMLSFLKRPLQRFDLQTAANPQYIIANSEFVKGWIKERYGRPSHVIYPPVDVEHFSISMEKEPYYITVGRLEPYKRFDLIVDAFNENGKPLVIIGDGSQLRSLRNKAKDNIRFTGFLERSAINDYLNKARAFVYAGVEDFGIVLVEALASGTPVIAYSGGAAGEIIRSEDDNGQLYDEQTADALQHAITLFEEHPTPFDSEKIQASALRFSKERFQAEFLSFLDKILVMPLLCMLLFLGGLLFPQSGQACPDTAAPRGKMDTTRFVWGANGHPTNQSAYWGNIDSQIVALRAADLSYYRIDVGFDDQGNMDGAAAARLSELAQKARPAGITLVPVLVPSLLRTLYDSSSVEEVYSKGYLLARGFALKDGSWFSYYELGNENDIQLISSSLVDGSDPSQYDTVKTRTLAALFRGMEDGIKSVNPAAKIIVSNAGWMHYAYFEVLAREGVHIDIIGYHWYYDLEHLKEALYALRTQYADKPVWFTEVNGRYSDEGNHDKQQYRRIKSYLRVIRKKGSNVKGFFVYELFDQPEASQGERRFGLITWTKPYSSFVYKPVAAKLPVLIGDFTSRRARQANSIQARKK